MNYVIRAQIHPPSDLFKLALLKGHTLFKFLQLVVGYDV